MYDAILEAIRAELKQRKMKYSTLALRVHREYNVGVTSVHRLLGGGNSTLKTIKAVTDYLGLEIEVKR